MKKILILLLMISCLMMGQSQGINTAFISTPAPPGPFSQFVATTGVTGQTNYYYWVVAVYPIGMAAALGPVQVVNANATLDSSNYTTISWQSPSSSVTGYWVVRSTTPVFPGTGTVAVNSSVIAATTFSQTDQSNTLNSFTFASIPYASSQIQMNNKDFSTPVVQVVNNGDSNVVLSMSETLLGINHFNVASAISGNPVLLRVGQTSDTNVGVTISPKGTGTVTIVGGTTGNTVSVLGAATATGTDTINLLAGNAAGTAIKSMNVLTGTPNTTGNNRYLLGSGAMTTKASINANFTGYQVMNYLNGGGVNNAITVTLVDSAGVNITQQAGLCMTLKLAPTLQAGANTIALNGAAVANLKKHTDPSANIGTAYAANGFINVCFDGTSYLDMSQ